MSDLRPGYKRTEVGPIPEEWDVSTVEEQAYITTGSRNTQDRVEDGEFPFFVRSQEVQQINSYSFDGEAVLTAGDGVGTGKVFHYINGKFDAHQRVYRISNFAERLNGKFFFWLFSTRFYDRIMAMTAKSSVDSVRREMIAKMRIALPPLVEQKVIVEALGDADTRIGALEALIAKKRDLRQGVMQELLTGQRRLPGFQGEWAKIPLGSLVGTLEAGVSVRSVPSDSSSVGHDDYVLKTSCISGGSFFLDEAKAILPEDRARARTPVRADTIIISRMNTPDLVGEVGYVPADFNKLFLPDRLWTAKRAPGCDVNMRWLATMLAHSAARQALKDMATGTSGSMKNISKTSLLGLVVPCPKPGEQHAIAAVLFDMDAEIATLEAKVVKTRAMKQGMMQVLLTGEVRLV